MLINVIFQLISIRSTNIIESKC